MPAATGFNVMWRYVSLLVGIAATHSGFASSAWIMVPTELSVEQAREVGFTVEQTPYFDDVPEVRIVAPPRDNSGCEIKSVSHHTIDDNADTIARAEIQIDDDESEIVYLLSSPNGEYSFSLFAYACGKRENHYIVLIDDPNRPRS